MTTHRIKTIKIKNELWNTYSELSRYITCFNCKENKISKRNIEIGYITRISEGGTNNINNLRPICNNCKKESKISSQPVSQPQPSHQKTCIAFNTIEGFEGFENFKFLEKTTTEKPTIEKFENKNTNSFTFTNGQSALIFNSKEDMETFAKPYFTAAKSHHKIELGKVKVNPNSQKCYKYLNKEGKLKIPITPRIISSEIGHSTKLLDENYSFKKNVYVKKQNKRGISLLTIPSYFKEGKVYEQIKEEVDKYKNSNQSEIFLLGYKFHPYVTEKGKKYIELTEFLQLHRLIGISNNMNN